jgi:two-component system sensor histidine kinase HydH
MVQKNNKAKMILIAILVVGISALHYGTDFSHRYLHIFYRELYLLPIVLAAFWFGLKGALATSLTITALFLPFTLSHWDNLSPDDFSLAMDKILYNIVAVILGILKDRERAKHRSLLEAESLAGMGKAVSDVAHDMKTPLTVIGGASRLIQKRMGKRDSSYEKLDMVIEQTERLENMVKKMLDFSRPVEVTRSHADIDKMIQKSTEVVVNAPGGARVKIHLNLSNELPTVPLNAMRMEQVLINLLINAVQASPDGETVTVSTSQEGGYVRIDITDCGCGIPREQREEIFTPFFTTRKEGTGLGLGIVRKIIQAHEGRVEVLDNPERGVTFRVLLPIGIE